MRLEVPNFEIHDSNKSYWKHKIFSQTSLNRFDEIIHILKQ